MIWRSRNSYNLIYWSFGFSGMQKVVKDFDRHTPTHNVNKTHTNAIETLWMIFQFHIKRPLPALLFILICTYFWQLFHYFFTSLKYYVKFIYQVESYYPTPPWDKQKWFKIYRIKLQWFTIIHVSSNTQGCSLSVRKWVSTEISKPSEKSKVYLKNYWYVQENLLSSWKQKMNYFNFFHL